AEAIDVRVVERSINLVEHADRRWVGQEDREDERQGRQSLLTAGQQRESCRLLSRWLGDDLEPALKGILAFDHLEARLASAEEGREELLEVGVDLIESLLKPLTGLLVELADATSELRDPRFDVALLGLKAFRLGEQGRQLLVGLKVPAT